MAFIRGLGFYFPKQRQSAADIAALSGVPVAVVRDKLGIAQKTIAGPDDHTNAMGVHAARAALTDAGFSAADLDVLISITEEHKEYPVWTAGIKAAHDLDASRAYAFDLGQKCGTGVLALKLAADMIKANGVSNALICGGYRNSDLVDYRDPSTRFLNNLAAAGGAAVVTRERPAAGSAQHICFEILGSAFRTDGSFSEDVIVPVGGTRRPLTADNLHEFRFQVPDPQGMKARLETRSLDHFAAVIEEACARSGLRPRDAAYVAMLHMKRSAHDEILRRVAVDPARSIYLSDYGHIGQIDPLLSLQLARDQGRLRNGDVAVLCAAGIGYVWNAICVRAHIAR